ncbi:MAG: hypothetical protein ACRDNL_15705 [Spirillospora sp.]
MSEELKYVAADKKRGMTLDELTAFVEEARGREFDGATRVNIVVTWRATIKELSLVEKPSS